MQARNEALNAIVKGKPIPKPGTPESFKVLMRELQSLGLDIAVHKLKLFEDGQRRTVEVDLMSDSKDNRVDRSNYDTPPVDDFEQFLY